MVFVCLYLVVWYTTKSLLKLFNRKVSDVSCKELLSDVKSFFVSFFSVNKSHDFTSEDLRTVTGWCLATCRQRLDNVSWLLSVIQEIVLAGEVTFSPPVVPTTEEVAA